MVKIQEFLQNAYYFIIDVLETDSILRVSSRKGNVVILPAAQYDCLMEMAYKKSDKRKN